MNHRKSYSPQESFVGESANGSSTKEYDVVILGCGEGGKYIAWTLGKQGQRVAVIERKYIGGSCPNIACLPSKNIIHSAKVASYVRRSEEFGITKENVRIGMDGVRERKRKMEGLVNVHLNNFKNGGADLVLGMGRFIGPKTPEVSPADGGRLVVRGDRIVIGTGTHARLPQIPGLAKSRALTHIEALELDRVPEHLIVMGGGYIGLELSQAMRRFGSRVTVIDRNARLAHREDEDVSQALEELCRDEGIELVLNARVRSVDGQSGTQVKLQVFTVDSEIELHGTHLLVATRRTPNTAGIGLDQARVELTPYGYIKVDEHLRITAPDVRAVGECAGTPQFTHISFDDFRVIVAHMAGRDRVTKGRQVPFRMFTDPELARVGLSENEARANGIPYRVAKIFMAAVLRAHPFRNTRIHEGVDRNRQRSNPGFHRVRRGRRRDHGRGPDRNDR
jgi:pyruvate/2-oxoglutarate dehydrogenase complex dihydrolipoamide dehydrogenase (E3) component